MFKPDKESCNFLMRYWAVHIEHQQLVGLPSSTAFNRMRIIKRTNSPARVTEICQKWFLIGRHEDVLLLQSASLSVGEWYQLFLSRWLTNFMLEWTILCEWRCASALAMPNICDACDFINIVHRVSLQVIIYTPSVISSFHFAPSRTWEVFPSPAIGIPGTYDHRKYSIQEPWGHFDGRIQTRPGSLQQ